MPQLVYSCNKKTDSSKHNIVQLETMLVAYRDSRSGLRSYSLPGTRVLVGGGVAFEGFEPSFEVISLGEAESGQTIKNITGIKEIYAAGTYKKRTIICGKL